MPRIRYLKPEFFTDEDLADLPLETRITFQGLWCYADKAGRLEDRPKFLKAMIFPYDKVDIERQLQALSKNKHNGKPFIQRYEIDGLRLIQILRWDRHQKPHHTEAESKFPPAPPLKEDKDKGDIYSVNEASASLDNVSLTVKTPLTLGTFKNVKITQEELDKLKDNLGEAVTMERIESLSEYMASKGKKYKSHYATVLAWARKDGIHGKQGNDPGNVGFFGKYLRENTK